MNDTGTKFGTDIQVRETFIGKFINTTFDIMNIYNLIIIIVIIVILLLIVMF